MKLALKERSGDLMGNLIKARRKLDELYRTGVEVRFGPGPNGPEGHIAPSGLGYFLDDVDGKRLPLGDDEIALWIQPPSPLQREMALRDAQAARARSLLKAKRDEDSEEHLTVMAFLADMSDETLFDYVLNAESDTLRQEAMREVLAEEQWENVTAYQDALRLYEEESPEEGSPAWEQYQELLQLDTKFAAQVRAIEKELYNTGLEAARMKGRAEAEKRAIGRRSEMVGSQAFIYEYERKMLYYSVRDADDTGVMFFESARDLAEVPDELAAILKEALEPFISEVAEAKNSQGAESGSESSEPPSKPETSEASIPQELTA